MNPNSFKNGGEFDVDHEIAKLWSELEKEFGKLDSKMIEGGPKKTSNHSGEFTTTLPSKSATQKEIFNPPDLPAYNFFSNPGPEVPHFLRNKKAKTYSMKYPEPQKTGTSEELKNRDIVRDRERWQKTGNKVIKTAIMAEKMHRNIKSIINEEINDFRHCTSDFYELNKTKLLDKYHIFKEEKHKNKKTMLHLGKKATTVLLIASTIGGTASAVSHTKNLNSPEDSIAVTTDRFDPTAKYKDEVIYNKIIFDENDAGNTKGDKQTTKESKNNKEYLDEQTTAAETTAAISLYPEIITDESNTNQYESSALSRQTRTISNESENNNEPTMDAIKTENIKKKSEIKDDMGLDIHLTDYMKEELDFVKKTYKENKETYLKIVKKIKEDTGFEIPAEAVCAIHYRESRCDFSRYLQNGEKLGQVTTLVPKGIYFENFYDSAVEAIKSQLNAYQDYDKIDLHSMSGLCKFTNRYNGTGSQRYYGLPSSYVYTGTNKYQGGMYVADGSFNRDKNDTRMGTYPIIAKLANLA